MDLPCFLLSWLRNLQLIPLTQSHTSWRRRLGIPNWEEKRVMISFFTGSQELFDHIKAIPQIWHPKTFNWSQKGRWSFGSLCCFAATHSRLDSQKCCIFGDNFYKLSIQCSMYEKWNEIFLKIVLFFNFQPTIILEGKKSHILGLVLVWNSWFYIHEPHHRKCHHGRPKRRWII